MKTIFFIIILQLSPFLVLSNVYYSKVNNLTIREQPNQSSKNKGRLDKGDEVEVMEVTKDWAKIKYLEHEYFVASKFLSTTPVRNNDLGFIDGFTKTYLYSLFILTFLSFIPEVTKRKIKDKRFREGFRQDKVPEMIMWKHFLYSGIFSLPVGLIGGLICWIL